MESLLFWTNSHILRRDTLIMEKKKYIVNSKRMATTIEFIGGLKYSVRDHHTEPDKKVYAFDNTEELQNVLSIIMAVKNTLNTK